MADERDDVKQEVEETSIPTEQTPAEIAEQAPQTEVEAPETEGAATPEPEPGTEQVDAYDDSGVPFKNRAMEWKRKHNDLVDQMPTLVQQAVEAALQKQPQQQKPKYTIEQLEGFAQQNPDYRPWVEAEKEKLRQEQFAQIVDAKMAESRRAQEAEAKRQQALNYVVENYSECFTKDKNGKVVDWNNTHPLTKEIAQLMQHPKLRDDPEGLVAAADIAYGRYAKRQTPQVIKKVANLKAEKKSLEKQTMVEGGGVAGGDTRSPMKDALAKARETGTKADAKAAMDIILRNIGVINDE